MLSHGYFRSRRGICAAIKVSFGNFLTRLEPENIGICGRATPAGRAHPPTPQSSRAGESFLSSRTINRPSAIEGETELQMQISHLHCTCGCPLPLDPPFLCGSAE